MAAQYPKAVVCRVLGVARSSIYQRADPAQDGELRTAISRVCEDFPYYGYRQVRAEVRRRGWAVNQKRVARLMRSMNLQTRKTVRNRRSTSSEHSFPRYPNLVQLLVMQRPDQVWAADIT